IVALDCTTHPPLSFYLVDNKWGNLKDSDNECIAGFRIVPKHTTTSVPDAVVAVKIIEVISHP
ncbi:TPA: hypothetical protein ACRGFC_004509, partial [Klebsiella pneumoniae]